MTRGVPLDIHVGQVFGRLTVLGRAPAKRWGRMYHCKCECGKTISVSASNLNCRAIKSCGCLRRERMAGIWRDEAHRLKWRESMLKANQAKARREKQTKVKFAKPAELHPDDRPAGPKKFSEAAALDLARALGAL